MALMWLGRDRRELRRLAGVHAYVGVGGSGKSLCMVHDTIPSLLAGRPVFSTVRLRVIDEQGRDYDHPLWRPLTDWMQLCSDEVRECDVLLDEAVGAASSHEWQAMPIQARNMIVQSRRRDVAIRWTSIQLSDGEKSLRAATQAVTVCKGYLPKQVPGRIHRQRSLFRFTTYDAREWQARETNLTSTAQNREKPLATHFFYRPGSEAETTYDTLAPVLMVRHVSQAGICGNCGGKRSVPKCVCPTEHKMLGSDELAGAQDVVVPAEWRL